MKKEKEKKKNKNENFYLILVRYKSINLITRNSNYEEPF